MSTFLVTGAAGFIGSNLAESLLAAGESLVLLDNFSTGKRENIAPFEQARVIEGSIADLQTCREAVQGVDYVLHQAALPSVPRSIEDPIASNDTNVAGTLNLLVAARDAGVKRFVYAGSSSVYGNSPTLPKVETMPTNPLSPYAIQKLTAEQYCKTFHDLFGLETIVLRYFNVFGPRQDPQSQYSAVIPKFINAMLADESPVINGDGEHSRDFTYIDNVVHANRLACEAPDVAAGEVYNCACGERLSLNELAGTIKEISGANAEVTHGSARPGDVEHSLANIDKARKRLGYAPRVSVREGLEKTVEWYRQRR